MKTYCMKWKCNIDFFLHAAIKILCDVSIVSENQSNGVIEGNYLHIVGGDWQTFFYPHCYFLLFEQTHSLFDDVVTFVTLCVWACLLIGTSWMSLSVKITRGTWLRNVTKHSQYLKEMRVLISVSINKVSLLMRDWCDMPLVRKMKSLLYICCLIFKHQIFKLPKSGRNLGPWIPSIEVTGHYYPDRCLILSMCFLTAAEGQAPLFWEFIRLSFQTLWALLFLWTRECHQDWGWTIQFP